MRGFSPNTVEPASRRPSGELFAPVARRFSAPDNSSCRVALAVALAATLIAGSAIAAEGNPHLPEAMGHIENGDLEAAKTALDRAMAHPENTNRDLVEIYATLAVVHLYAGSESLAYEAYVRLLNIDPGYQLPPHTAGPLQELFERVAHAYEEGHLRAVRVAHDPPGTVSVGVPAVINSTISNMSDEFRGELRYRRQGQDDFGRLRLSARPGHQWAATLPSIDPGEVNGDPLVIEYYVEVVNESGQRVQGSGNAREPHLLRVVAALSGDEPGVEPPAPWYQRPWVWGAVGGVAIGSAAAVYLGVRSSGSGTLPVRVRVREEL